MKILVAITSDNNSNELGETTLVWAARAGFNLRIFIPTEHQRNEYQTMIDDLNHREYLDVSYAAIIAERFPAEFAIENGFDLLLELPDDMPEWNTEKNKDKMVMDFAIDVARARKQFSTNDKKRQHDFNNGAIMQRL